MKLRNLTTLLLSAAVCTAPALAQQDDRRGDDQGQDRQQQTDRQQRSDRQQQSDRRDRDSDDRQRSDSRRQSASDQQRRGDRSAQNRGVQVDPRGWVSMAVDYNNDGVYDGVETIYIYDLEKARQSSQNRKARDGRDARASEQQDRPSYESHRPSVDRPDRMRAERSRTMSISGTIDSMRTQQLAGMDKPHQLAKIDTNDDKRLVVCLGTEEELEKLDLSDGDRVNVRGTKARINDRTVMLAKEVRHDGQTVRLKSPQDGQSKKSRMKRVKADVLQTRTVRFRGFDQPFLVARVETQSGKKETVNMGPASKFDDLEIEQGTEVRLLVRQGRVNGRDALIAQEVNVDGDTIKLERPKNRKRFPLKSQQDQRDRDRRQR